MFISQKQFGFRKGCGTREAIGVMRAFCDAMKKNIKKTKVMRVSRERGKVNITINGTKIEQVEICKYLGHAMTT